LKLGGVPVLRRGRAKLLLIHDARAMPGTPHHVQLVIGVAEIPIFDVRGTGDMHVYLLQLPIRQVHFHQVVRTREPVHGAHVETADPSALRPVDVVTGG